MEKKMHKERLKRKMQDEDIDLGDIVSITDTENASRIGYVYYPLKEDDGYLWLSHQDPLERFSDGIEREIFSVSFKSSVAYELLKKRTEEERNKGLSLRQPTLIEYNNDSENQLTINDIRVFVLGNRWDSSRPEYFIEKAREQRVLGKVKKGLAVLRLGSKSFHPTEIASNIASNIGLEKPTDVKPDDIEMELRKEIGFSTYDIRELQYADSFAITERKEAIKGYGYIRVANVFDSGSPAYIRVDYFRKMKNIISSF